MDKYLCFESDLAERKLLLSSIYKANKKKIIWILLDALLFFISAFILFGTIGYTIYTKDFSQGIFVIIASAQLACVPFFIAVSLKNTIKFKCTLPYCERANEQLKFYDDRMEYSYIKVKKNNAAAYSMLKYENGDYNYFDMHHLVIYYSKIDNVEFENSVCKIYGEFSLLKPYSDKRDFKEQELKTFNILMNFGIDNKNVKERLTEIER